jgi:hypothetical protein
VRSEKRRNEHVPIATGTRERPGRVRVWAHRVLGALKRSGDPEIPGTSRHRLARMVLSIDSWVDVRSQVCASCRPDGCPIALRPARCTVGGRMTQLFTRSTALLNIAACVAVLVGSVAGPQWLAFIGSIGVLAVMAWTVFAAKRAGHDPFPDLRDDSDERHRPRRPTTSP